MVLYGGVGIWCGWASGIRGYDVCCLKHFSNPFLIILAFFPSFSLKNLSPFKYSPVPSGFSYLLKREKTEKRWGYYFRNPSESLENSGGCPVFGKKNMRKRKKEEDGDFWYILLPTRLLFMMPAASAFFLILSDTPHLFFFLKKKSSVRDFGLCHEGF